MKERVAKRSAGVLALCALLTSACSSQVADTFGSTTTPPEIAAPTTTTAVGDRIDYVAYVEEALDFAEENLHWTEEVDWAPIREEALAAVRSDPGPVRAHYALGLLVNAVVRYPDHTRFYPPEAWAEFEDQLENPTSGDPPTGERLEGGIGYLNLPTTLFSDEWATYAQQLRGLIEDIDSAAPVCGWVIDLRRYEGGDSWVGWAGLGPLLGEGVFFRFVTNSETIELSYENRRLYENGEPAVKESADPSPYYVSNGYIPHYPDAPIAVLTSALTASAAEANLVSLLGRPNTRSFGEPTSGIPEAPTALDLPDGASLWITTFLYQDRLGRTYDTSIPPDELVLSLPGQEGDPVLDAATDWLQATDSCASDG